MIAQGKANKNRPVPGRARTHLQLKARVSFDWGTKPTTTAAAFVQSPLAPDLPPTTDPDRIDRSHQAVREAIMAVEAEEAERDASKVTIPNGWSAKAWAYRLKELADACAAEHPDKAATYREEAAAIERGTAR